MDMWEIIGPSRSTRKAPERLGEAGDRDLREMSACEDNDELLGEGLQTDGYNGCGKKKPTSERSSTELPPVEKKKQDHRAEVWQHFIQREDSPSIINCQYYVQEIGCETKKVGQTP
ncbi:hypothetical protein F2Q69_00047657 [Brassica cretica]|uniref:Uncharacterized protein n=1 Tax=Brassica cretica TaxID=69181 RepID=A0A8S9PMC0_BRACR|nr:hypothetical protein F2Q69_00047657 [Brassica cretica]